MTGEVISLFDPDTPVSDPASGQPQALTLPAPAGWPAPPAEDAFHGLPGAIVEKIAPNTEADPIAILIQLLVACGALTGRGGFFQVEATRHHANQFAVLVGDSSRARICCVQHILAYGAHRTMLRSALSAKAHLAACVMTAACGEGGVSDR
jgi:hypothetical protein